MRRSRLILVALPLTLAVAACSGAATSAAPPTTAPVVAAASEPAASASTAPSAAPSSAAPSTEPSAAASADNGPTAAPTALDPAKLLTQSEATSLAGVTLGACTATEVDNRKTCTYSAPGVQVEVTVIQAPSQAALDAGKAAVLADLQKAAANGLKTTQITGIGDDAALLSGGMTSNGITLTGIGVYAVKGLTFVAVTDIGIGHAIPDAKTIEAAATTTMGRVP